MLDLSHNPEMEAIPSEVGWLPLNVLEIEGNPKLKMPKIVIDRGFRCGECFLCELSYVEFKLHCLNIDQLSF